MDKMSLRTLRGFAVVGLHLSLGGCDMNPDKPVLLGNQEVRIPIEASEGTALAEPTEVAPNIVFILADDLGWGDVGFNGSQIRTPILDRLAATGARLERYYTYSICSPTRAALLTGRSAFEIGVDGPIDGAEGLPLSLTLLPEDLKQQGYDTALVGKWHLGAPTTEYLPHERGFDSFYGFLGGFVDHYTHISPSGALDWQRDGQTVREEGYSTELLTNEALRVIQERNPDSPFFLFLSYAAPHSPIQAPDKIVETYAAIEDPVRREYAAMVELMDAGVGEIIDALKAEGIAGETLIIWTSDNGGNEAAGASNGDLRGGKATGFDGGVRVPAIVNWPGTIAPGTVIAEPTSVHDWRPTILNLVGFTETDPALVGSDIFRLLDGKERSPTDIIVGGGRPERPIVRSVISSPWKLISSTPRSPAGDDTSAAGSEAEPQPLLFNIVDDPTETTNLYAEEMGVVERLLAVLESSELAASLTEKRDMGGPKGPRGPEAWLRGFDEETRSPVAETLELAD